MDKPAVFVIFGATGDLIEKKIAPSLFRLYKNKKLPQLLRVIGISRREYTTESFRNHIRDILAKSENPENNDLQAFLNIFEYMSGDFYERNIYESLAEILGRTETEWKACSNKLYYLAVPPLHYETIIANLKEVGLNTPCSDAEGYARVLLEKPFGRDEKTAQALEVTLQSAFSQEQIYRIDHYLGKKMIQNLLAFRFSNTIFEGAWSNKYIEKVEIKLLEGGDVSGRGAFYDALGAFRDVGQNHLLEIAAHIAMDNPEDFSAGPVRRSRAQILQKLKVPTREDISRRTFRGQYEGYKNTEGVSSDSTMETYFKIEAEFDDPRWYGVPFVLESGKSLKTHKKEVVITFRRPMPCLCPPGQNIDSRNEILFKIEPQESIQLDLWAKTDSYDMVVEQKRFLLNERDQTDRLQYVEEYEQLLLDAFTGDQTFFVSADEVRALWKFTDPFVAGWKADIVPLVSYVKGSDTPREASKFINDGKTAGVDETLLRREIAIVGLGKMGTNLALNLRSHGWNVIGYNRTYENAKHLLNEGIEVVKELQEIAVKLPTPRVVWLMLPSESVESVIAELSTILATGDIVIDGGNTHYKMAQHHADLLRAKGIEFVDVGVSGGPSGARNGAALMVGGNKKLYQHLSFLYQDLSYPQGVNHFDGIGAGHFVKMVHNGIEYGMMQSIAEGFEVLSASSYSLDLRATAHVYAHGSVIESRLISWLAHAMDVQGPTLPESSATVDHTGEGEWTVETAHELGVPVPALTAAVSYRKRSAQEPRYAGKVLTAMRNQFGGHPLKK